PASDRGRHDRTPPDEGSSLRSAVPQPRQWLCGGRQRAGEPVQAAARLLGWYHGHPGGAPAAQGLTSGATHSTVLGWPGERPPDPGLSPRPPTPFTATSARRQPRSIDRQRAIKEMKGGGCDDRDAEPSGAAGPGHDDDQAG